MVKYHGKADLRGGGHFSGRLTAPICIAGGLCLQYLNEHYDITIGAHVYQIGDVKDTPFDSVNIAKDTLDEIKAKTLPVIDEEKGALMQKEIERVRDLGDSIGGVVECAAVGVPVGLGEHMFWGAENRIAASLLLSLR